MAEKTKQEIREEWIAALRSGEYKQIRGRLHNSSGFCCLGVLADLYLKEQGRNWGGDYYIIGKDGSYFETLLTSEIVTWAGLYDDGGSRVIDGQFSPESLAMMNDGAGNLKTHSFEDIADLLEKYPNEFFTE